MSNEEQMSAIGRLIIDRTHARRQHALRESEIRSLAVTVNNLSGNIPFPEDPAKLARSIEKIDALIAAGGLDHLKTILSEYRDLTQVITEIGQTLKKAGAE